ncbi:hypothetical protein C0J52_10831 [Blattella germanica]|nr:hypothetical protein C0J52_10831 [Blattella germanica]
MLSVLVVGMDSVSRMNFHRQMPNTSMFLKKMDAIELLGYNKIDDNTFLNLVAVLSGFTEKEIAKSCWSGKGYFDECHWVWENYSMAGYRTAFGEDASDMGLFTYMRPGFKEQPTDYNLRPFMYSSEEDIGYNKDPYCKVCLGSEMTIVVLLRYITKYAQTMAAKNSFAFFWGSSLSHDFLNYPSLGDDLYEDFFSNLINSGYLNNTVLIFMSDHGMRWGDIRKTYQGRLEERLPFVFFVFPKWFKEKYPAAVTNLRENAHHLTTPFDLYSTLLDIVDLKQLEQNSIKERSGKLAKTEPMPRSISLFLPVHRSRTCEEAGVEKHWCTCQASKALPNDDSIVKRMSVIIVDHINSLLRPHSLCSQLKLEDVKSASVEFPGDDLSQNTKNTGLKDYVVIVNTSPGNALFEATVRHHVQSNNVTVIGTVSRINSYGNQSSCVTDYHMKLYCYCDYNLQKENHDK